MWYFAWMLGVGFALLLAIMNAMWGENEAARAQQDEDEEEDGGEQRESAP
jgi:cyd operon protein YbgT